MEQDKIGFEKLIVSDFFQLLSIAAELYEPLNAYQYELPKGICLLTEEPEQLDSLLLSLKQLEDVEVLYSSKTSKLSLPNYKLCIYAPQKYDKAESIHNFLNSPGFLTAVIVGGSIPDKFTDKYKVFIPSESFSRDLDDEISDIKDFLRNHPDFMENELSLFESCADFMNHSDKPPLYIQLLIAAKMYCLWHRSIHSEYEKKKGIAHFCNPYKTFLNLPKNDLIQLT